MCEIRSDLCCVVVNNAVRRHYVTERWRARCWRVSQRNNAVCSRRRVRRGGGTRCCCWLVLVVVYGFVRVSSLFRATNTINFLIEFYSLAGTSFNCAMSNDACVGGACESCAVVDVVKNVTMLPVECPATNALRVNFRLLSIDAYQVFHRI